MHTLLTEHSHVKVIECSANQGLWLGAKEVDKALVDIQFKPSIYGHAAHELFIAAVWPCMGTVGVARNNVM